MLHHIASRYRSLKRLSGTQAIALSQLAKRSPGSCPSPRVCPSQSWHVEMVSLLRLGKLTKETSSRFLCFLQSLKVNKNSKGSQGERRCNPWNLWRVLHISYICLRIFSWRLSNCNFYLPCLGCQCLTSYHVVFANPGPAGSIFNQLILSKLRDVESFKTMHVFDIARFLVSFPPNLRRWQIFGMLLNDPVDLIQTDSQF